MLIIVLWKAGSETRVFFRAFVIKTHSMGDSITPSMKVETAIDWQLDNSEVRNYHLELAPQARNQNS